MENGLHACDFARKGADKGSVLFSMEQRGGRAMRYLHELPHYLNTLPRFLVNLSYTARLCIAVSCVVLFLSAYMLLFQSTANPSLLAIPTALVAWMFKTRGMLLCVVTILVVTFIFVHVKYGFALFDPHLVLTFVSGGSALMGLGLLISFQRSSFDQSNAARMREMQINEQQLLLNQLKDQFILNVNHELRTPLTAIYGYLEMLIERNSELDVRTRGVFLKSALYSCEELQALINNILGSIEIVKEKDYCQVEELALAQVVREVIEHFDPKRILEHRLVFDVSDYIVVLANAQYTRQVLRNLLSNACKYSPPGSPITISAALHGSVVQRDHARPEICVSVQDAGPGIPPDEAPLLFGQFVRLKRDLTGTVRGTGLGLYVSKQLVEVMGGRIWVESKGIAGEGSRFCFTLPCVQRPYGYQMGKRCEVVGEGN